MNIKNVGLNTLLHIAPTLRSSTLLATRVARSHQQNKLLFIVQYRKPSADIMLEADYDRLQAVADWKNFGFKPERFSPLITGTIHL